jgi:hypothetical protein
MGVKAQDTCHNKFLIFSVDESYAQLSVAFFPAEHDKSCREKLRQKLKSRL